MSLSVVISQAQGRNPAKRELEESLATRLLMEPGVDVSLVPHLYDMPADHPGLLHLRNLPGDIVLLSWLFPRASRWILDRQDVRGREGVSELNDPDEEPIEPNGAATTDGDTSVVDRGPIPNRRIYCLDLREPGDAESYFDEICRIRDAAALSLVGLDLAAATPKRTPSPIQAEVKRVDEQTPRRWYPVIDYSRCTNCMECIDFCLFGVYGVDSLDQIQVESQDNCKKGCPACSRVCPENAIVFPGHKTPAIAGADGEVAGLKLDLSKLFGGPVSDDLDTAIAERDAELVADGREAVGASVGLPKRQAASSAQPSDELDDLLDAI